MFEFFTKLYKTDDIAKGFLYLSLVRILSKLSGKKIILCLSASYGSFCKSYAFTIQKLFF
ncbi:hypothetical protein HMPREF9151_00652 [Hoylesella saccharolytica F0055]|uniref:Uncharacterized protein n=1 Tax=Hoylesella saccharolytica F0055 TaxID=1127699 RepID=L1NHQ7_9BACT|nr:hypothetical protein HMPREF9151_00652 [Hoylesella saccharolytica F0055]